MSNVSVVGWDIGGVNTKVARAHRDTVLATRVHPYELQRDPAALGPLITTLAEHVGAQPTDIHAVTMTAELSQMFRTKREGVAFVLDAVTSALPLSDVRVYAVDGRFLSPADARREPLAVAASNWAATARVVGIEHPNAILIDIGTTTTDIIPMVDGAVVATGLTDPARLTSSELVYTGALRTPVEAIAHHVPLGDSLAGVSAEGFALAGDVHLWRGDLSPDDYTVPTPDGRPATRAFAGERLARVVCADRDMLTDQAICVIADALAQAQVDSVARAISKVRDRHPALRTAVVTGLGAFIATAAARQAGLDVVLLADAIGADASRCAPAAAVALLLAREMTRASEPNARTGAIDAVIKIGGGLLSHPRHFDAVLSAVSDAARWLRLVVVPGGGPFADVVRSVDRDLRLADDAAHWMAVLAMDQHAHLLASRHDEFAVVTTLDEIQSALAESSVPVLAPSQWLRAADPLPHSWDVTSDSIAAWLAGALGAPRLILIKPPGAAGDTAVDPYFPKALPPGVAWTLIPADEIARLPLALRDPGSD